MYTDFAVQNKNITTKQRVSDQVILKCFVYLQIVCMLTAIYINPQDFVYLNLSFEESLLKFEKRPLLQLCPSEKARYFLDLSHSNGDIKVPLLLWILRNASWLLHIT